MNLKVSKRFLLFEAALVWTFAGGMLLFRGNTYLDTSAGFPYLSIEASITCGLIFFMLLFLKISRSHIRRISQLPGDSHRLYEFFSFRSYLMMVGMISLGIFLRKSSMIPLNTLALAYITMGIPLLLSSVLFLLSVGSRAGSRIAGSRKAWGLEHGAGGWENGDRRTENGDRRRENGDRRRENGDRRTEKEF